MSNSSGEEVFHVSKRSRHEFSESVLWPESERTFFTNFDSQKWSETKSDKCRAFDKDLHIATFDDSLFGDTDFPESQKSNVGGTPLEMPTLPSSQGGIDENNTFFSEINLDDLINIADEDDMTTGDLPKDDEDFVQSTQKFMEDIAATMPPPKRQRIESDGSFISKSIREDMVQGTQYETREVIQNRSMRHNKTQQANDIAQQESNALSNFDWATQAFPCIDTFPSKGNFYCLPDKVKQLIIEHKGIQSLYEWQDECLNLPAVRERRNLIYALPTSGGKTLVAEILMLREIICREKNVLFILPYVSIVQEKVMSMSPFAIALDFIVDEYTAGKGKCPPAPRKKRKSVFIASIEKGAILMDSLIDTDRANEIGLIVVDELHLIGEKGRGATLEAFLTKVMFLNAGIQIVGMSATIGNLTEISKFLNADVYTRGFRPVELKEYIKCGSDILQINAAGKTLEEVFVFSRKINFKYSEAVSRADPDHLAGLVSECAPENCCLVFCPTRKNCEHVAMLLSRILPKTKFLEYRKKEKADLMDALDKVCGVLSPVLAHTIPFGVAYHHSGLTTDERRFIEIAYRFGVISVICCTSTLAAGVNLPAKRVIIRAPYVGAEFMTLCRYKQMVGRAGRAGLGEAGESILISTSRDNARIGEMLFSPMDKAMSSLGAQDCMGLEGLVLSAIGLGLSCCRRDLTRLTDSTLMAVQADFLGIDVRKATQDLLRDMFKARVLELSGTNKRTSDCGDILTSQDDMNKSDQEKPDRRLYIGQTTRFQLTTIGRAAFKAGIDYKRAYVINNELKIAQKNLLLNNYDHLLYLVVAFNSNANGDELFAADASTLFNLYNLLDESRQALFKWLGCGEAQIAKLGKTLSVHGPKELKTNRLYKVLILGDILNLMPVPAVAEKYKIERGILQNLISQSTSAANAIVRLCDEIDEFWCFKPLFERVGSKMDRCGTLELEPLLELPAVKMNRAKQLYAAGFRTIEDIAKSRPMQLVRSVEHMPMRIAKEIVSAAKIILMKKLDHLEEETEAIKMCLKPENG